MIFLQDCCSVAISNKTKNMGHWLKISTPTVISPTSASCIKIKYEGITF